MARDTSKDVTHQQTMSKLSEKTKQTSASLLNSTKVAPKALADSGDMDGVLGKIYQLMVDNRQDELAQRVIDEKNSKTDAGKEEQRHQELLKALTIRRRPKPKRVIRREKKAEEKEAAKPTEPLKPTAAGKKPPEAAKKEAEDKAKKAAEDKAKKEAEDKAKKESQAAKDKADKEAKAAKDRAEKESQAAKEKADKEAKQAAEKVKKEEAKKKETATEVKPPEVKPPPKAEAAPAAPKPPSPVKPGVATAAKVAKEAPFLYAATQNTKFMAGLGVLSTKYNSTVPDLLSFMMNESGLNPAAHNKNGGASGLIQIMPSTLKGMKERGYKSVKDINTVDDLRKLSIEEQLPIIDDYFNYTQLEKSAKVAKEQGRNVDLATLYSAVFLPAFKDKPNDFIMGIKPGETVNGKKSSDIFYGKTTYGDVYLANNAFDKGSKVTKKDAKGKPLEVEGGKGYFTKGDVGIKAGKFNDLVSQSLSVNDSGLKIDQSSKENADLKEKLNKDKSSQTTNNTTTTNNQTNNVQPQQRVDDRPPHIRKQQQ